MLTIRNDRKRKKKLGKGDEKVILNETGVKSLSFTEEMWMPKIHCEETKREEKCWNIPITLNAISILSRIHVFLSFESTRGQENRKRSERK
jgi:hypothetical protein